MNMATAVKKAHDVKGPKEAARHYNDLNYELALGEHPPEHEQNGEEAQRILEERFPGVREAANEVEEPPRLSRRAGDRLRSDGDRARRAVRSRRGTHKPSAPKPESSETAPAPKPGRRERAVRAGGRALASAGQGATSAANAAADSSWGELLTELFLWGVGLSALFLLLTHAKGPSSLVTGATNVVRGIVSPHVDPLNPKG